MINLLLRYAKDLNDAYPNHEFSIWDKEQLLGYFNDALCLIALYRPDMFAELKVVKVDSCTGYLDLCDCTDILEVLGQSDASGRNIKPLLKREQKKNPVWIGKKTTQVLTKDLTEYELVGNNLVRVYPENLDPTEDYYALVRCVVPPKNYSLADGAPNENCAFLSAARHWVLANAKMMDAEFSPTMQSQAKDHRDIFFTILKISHEIRKELEEKLDKRNKKK